MLTIIDAKSSKSTNSSRAFTWDFREFRCRAVCCDRTSNAIINFLHIIAPRTIIFRHYNTGEGVEYQRIQVENTDGKWLGKRICAASKRSTNVLLTFTVIQIFSIVEFSCIEKKKIDCPRDHCRPRPDPTRGDLPLIH